jgi:hypothetical protein
LCFGFKIAATYSLGAAIAFASEPLPKPESSDEPILSEAEALRVVAQEVLLRQAPSLTAKRRGTLRQGTEVWAYAQVTTADCPWGWLLVGPSAWACDAEGTFDGRHETLGSPKNEPMSLRFARIGDRGALAYHTWSKVEQGLPDAELQPGFFVGIVEENISGPDRYYRTTHGLYFLAQDAQVLLPSAFTGRLLEEIEPVEGLSPYLPIGWVYVSNARTSNAPSGPALGNKVPRLTEVSVLSQQLGRDKLTWFRTHLGWLSERQVRVPSFAPAPEAARNEGQYIDVDTNTQTLVAYRDEKPWFATLVSTGLDATATPKGEFRVWAKLLYSDMDNLDEQTRGDDTQFEQNPYAVEAVPWVLFFSGGYGLHATYWHNGFGAKKSHGCVNLSLADAKRLFEFASPRLGTGWQAAHPSDYDPGTIIRVR